MLNVAIIPPDPVFLENELFNLDSIYNRDDCLHPYYFIKEKFSKEDININTVDIYSDKKVIDVLLVYNINNNLGKVIEFIKINNDVFVIYIMTEPLVVNSLHHKKLLELQLFDQILSWNDDYVNCEKVKKFNYPNPVRVYNNPKSFDEKKKLCLINSFKIKKHKYELYSERIQAIKYFGKKNQIDLYGMGWSKSSDNTVSQVYKGEVLSKIEVFKNYKYSICFENSKGEKGYITEKILDSICSGCVPIYYGAENIKEHIPFNCFIDFRDLNLSYANLNNYLDKIDEIKYQEYQNEIQKFLSSKDYLKFTEKFFYEVISDSIKDIENKKKSIRNDLKNILEIVLNNEFYVKDRLKLIYNLVSTLY